MTAPDCPLPRIDSACDRLLITLRDAFPGAPDALHGAAMLAALQVVYPDVPDDVLAERIAAALLV